MEAARATKQERVSHGPIYILVHDVSTKIVAHVENAMSTFL